MVAQTRPPSISQMSRVELQALGKRLREARDRSVPRERKTVWHDRYRSIANLERHLHANGTRIIKFFLHLSKDEQRKRFLARNVAISGGTFRSARSPAGAPPVISPAPLNLPALGGEELQPRGRGGAPHAHVWRKTSGSAKIF
jgi:hypothetical protein